MAQRFSAVQNFWVAQRFRAVQNFWVVQRFSAAISYLLSTGALAPEAHPPKHIQ